MPMMHTIRCTTSVSLVTICRRLSGPVLLHLPPGVSILAASVSVPQLDAVPLLVVAVVLHPLDVAVATILHVRMTAVTATALAAQRTGIVMRRTSVIVRRVAKTAPTETIGKLPWNLPHKLTMSWTQLSNRSAHLSETYVSAEKSYYAAFGLLSFFPRRQIITSLLCFQICCPRVSPRFGPHRASTFLGGTLEFENRNSDVSNS